MCYLNHGQFFSRQQGAAFLRNHLLLSAEFALSGADEKLERYTAVKRSGYDLDKTAKKAASLCDVTPEDIFSKSRQKTKVKARSLFCYWATRELGISLTEIARQLGISTPAVSYAVARGEEIARKDNHRLVDQ